MVKSRRDLVFDTAIFIVLALAALAAVFPLLYVLSVSLTPYAEVVKNGGFVLLPKHITFSAYKGLFQQTGLPQAFGVNVFITVVGTFVNMLLTVLMAYPLSRRKLKGRSLLLLLVVFTMLFSGGLIPTYLVVKATGLLNTVWAMILPNAIWSFNILIMKSFFESLPEELFESAKIDGAGESRILLQMVVPLSLPSMMTVGLFYMVGHWNELFQAVLYVTDPDLHPLQVFVRNILLQSQMSEIAVDVTLPTQTLQMAAVLVASLPIIAVYPFIQKYFTKGMLLGSIKG
ncbi:carbohydrate ABC transporter permease [Cohnella sp. GCM10020058]|uniref:carbohydrate ABC transporter permease n=1 Tax=Cohnella sp. GCM10020058 TaxID=3317330 RepID=UPI00363A1644